MKVKIERWAFTTWRDRHRSSPAVVREQLRRESSGETSVVPSTPTPSEPAIWKDSGLVEVCQSGGCGRWIGFGSTLRGGIVAKSLFHSKDSRVHICGIICSASRS